MNSRLVTILGLGLAGLLLGYAIYGRDPFNGAYVSPADLFAPLDGLSALLVGPALSGMRQRILTAGAVGLGLGVIVAVLSQPPTTGDAKGR